MKNNNTKRESVLFIISTEKSTYSMGETITLKGKLKNISPHPLLINTKMIVWGDQIMEGGFGIALSILTPSFKQIKFGVMPEMDGPTKKWFVILQPNKEFKGDIYFGEEERLKELGRYRITATYYNYLSHYFDMHNKKILIDAWLGTIESNPIEIEIK